MNLVSIVDHDRAAIAPEPLPSVETGQDLTEDSVARIWADRHADRRRYCVSSGRWFRLEPTGIWRVDETNSTTHSIRETVRELAAGEQAPKRFQLGRLAFTRGAEAFCRADPRLAVTIDAWDRDPLLLGNPEGAVDLRAGRLRRALPEDGITKKTSVAPAERADCPTFLRFLTEATGGDAELIQFIQQWFGYSLTGDVREQALCFLYGGGGNGKSVLLNVMTNILGDYAVTAAMDSFVGQGSGHSTDYAMMRGARLVTASETEANRPWAEARIKSLTGSEKVTARFMRQDNFTYLPTFKILIAGNHQPVLRVVDDAAKRRFLMIPFIRKPEKPDRYLEEKLRAEYPAILRWAIDGCLAWQRDGLIRPPVVMTATADYFDTQDLLGNWLDEHCEVEPGNHYKSETIDALYRSWAAFVRASGSDPESKPSFGQRLEGRGLTRYRKSTSRGFLGIRLRPPADWQRDHEQGDDLL